MKTNTHMALIGGISTALMALYAAPVVAQQNLTVLSGTAPTMLVTGESGGELTLTVGHSKLLQADQPIGMIIVGDDTIANTTVGAGNSIIVTGLSEGSTNLIVLSKSQELLISSTIAIAPTAGRLRSVVTVRRGTVAEERYECRDTCALTQARVDGAALPVAAPAPASEPGTEEFAAATR